MKKHWAKENWKHQVNFAFLKKNKKNVILCRLKILNKINSIIKELKNSELVFFRNLISKNKLLILLKRKYFKNWMEFLKATSQQNGFAHLNFLKLDVYICMLNCFPIGKREVPNAEFCFVWIGNSFDVSDPMWICSTKFSAFHVTTVVIRANDDMPRLDISRARAQKFHHHRIALANFLQSQTLPLHFVLYTFIQHTQQNHTKINYAYDHKNKIALRFLKNCNMFNLLSLECYRIFPLSIFSCRTQQCFLWAFRSW